MINVVLMTLLLVALAWVPGMPIPPRYPYPGAGWSKYGDLRFEALETPANGTAKFRRSHRRPGLELIKRDTECAMFDPTIGEVWSVRNPVSDKVRVRYPDGAVVVYAVVVVTARNADAS